MSNQPQAHVADERAAFEQEMLRRDIIGDEGFDRRATGEYVDDTTEAAWESWQAARAAIPAGANVVADKALPNLWMHDDMDADATESVASLPRKQLVSYYKDSRSDTIKWRRRALEAESRIAAGAPAETLKPTGHKPPLPEADRLGPLGERLFLVGTLCNYGTACAIAAQPAPAPATDMRRIGYWYPEHGQAFISDTAPPGSEPIFAAMLSANSPREAE